MKEAQTFTKFANGLCILAGVGCLFCLATIFLGHLNGGYSPKSRVMSKLKQISISLIIYTEDSDGRLPLVYTSDDFKTALAPYTKDKSYLFEPFEHHSTAPAFNYNLAGVDISSDIVPLGHKEPLPPSEIPMVYALLTDPKLESPAVISYADSSTKAWSSDKPFDPGDIFALQFAREGGK